MSYTETHFGKVREIIVPLDMDFKSKLEYIQNDLGFTIDYIDPHGEYIESEKVVYVNGKFYQHLNHLEAKDGDIASAFENSDGTINYVLQYYNGGCGFEEALGDALSKNDKEQGR